MKFASFLSAKASLSASLPKLKLRKEPKDKDTKWTITGEDELGLCSRYLTKFMIVDHKGEICDLEDLHFEYQNQLRRRHFYAIGFVVNGADYLLIKTTRIVDWNIEIGLRPSSGIWIATGNAWYKLLSPKTTYKNIYRPLAIKAHLCIVIASILNVHSTNLSIDEMLMELQSQAFPKTTDSPEMLQQYLLDNVDFFYDIFSLSFDPASPFMQEFQRYCREAKVEKVITCTNCTDRVPITETRSHSRHCLA